MAALDTNVLVRYLVRDDAGQLRTVRALMEAAAQQQQALLVPVTVMLELEWGLRGCYGFDKSEVIAALAALLSTQELLFQSETAVEVALVLYRDGKADFSDCLHAALAHETGQTPLWTFDKAAAKLKGAQHLSPEALVR